MSLQRVVRLGELLISGDRDEPGIMITDRLSDLLGGHTVDEHPELADRLRALAHELLADDATLLREASPVLAHSAGGPRP